MPQTSEDLTNPRQILRELHNILVGRQNWSDNEKRRLSTWVKSSTIHKNSDAIFARLRDEIGVGFSELFPVWTEDKVNFKSITGKHPYVGQFFTQQIWLRNRDNLLSFLTAWILEIEKINSSDIRGELAFGKITELLSTIVEHKKSLYSMSRDNSYWLPDELLIDIMLDKYWFLPLYENSNSSHLRLILPIQRVLQNIVNLKEAKSQNDLASKAVEDLPSLEHSKYDSKNSAFETLKKSLNRLKNGQNLALYQINKMRKIPFSMDILDESWVSKNEEEKSKIIKRIATYFKLNTMSDKEFNKFNLRWEKFFNNQYKVIKESADGIFETIIVLAYLLSKIILDIQKDYPEAGLHFAKLNPETVQNCPKTF